MGYAYQAEHWCDSCGEEIEKSLRRKGVEDTGDSDDFPQYFEDAYEEADSPCHCGSGEDCLEAISLEEPGKMRKSKVRRVGAIVCKRLTSDGVEYVKESHARRPTSVTEFWLDFYDL
jgi:hypothetical protein